LTLAAFGFVEREGAAVISEEELMDARALARQGYTYAEIGRLLGRDWRTVKRYLETGAQPAYRRRRMPSKLDEFKPLIDQWLAATPGLQATRIHQDLVRDYGFEGSYNTVRRYVERSRPRRRRGPRSALRPGLAIRRRLTGHTSSQSARARGSSCRSTASTWSLATPATRSARSRARRIW
jgi:transposase